MREELLRELKKITAEERAILGDNAINKSLYTSNGEFNIESGKLLKIGRYIAARLHTRFIDFPEHGHNYIEIMYVCSGKITHIINGGEIVTEAGDILFMNQQVKHSIKKTEVNDLGINFIILPEFFKIPLLMLKEEKKHALAEFLIAALRIDERRPQYLHFKTAGNLAIENLMENIIQSLFSGKEEESINQFTMGLIFLQLLSNIDSISENSFQTGQDFMAETALRYIRKRYQDANLKELASNMQQSPSNMCKIIKKSTGYTFGALLQKVRFQQAKIFLTDTKMTVSEIMNTVGYENSSYFYKEFRRRYGMSPREYRMKNKEARD